MNVVIKMNRKIMKSILFLAGCLLGIGLQLSAQPVDSLYKEKYRPQYHFSPKKGWIGDPCGFIHYQNKYHMYWWGKVESRDLVHYQEVTPFTMTGENIDMNYFTGSMVIDKHNTAGFGKDAYVAVYTIAEKVSKKQSQGISFSHDGKSFQYYEDNPVLDIGSTEFRDPTVFYYEPTKRWVMVVAKALEKKVQIYSSADLKHWKWESDFGPCGDQEKSWECPDLFQLPVDGDWNNKWVMVISVNWAKEQYFIGDFDGKEFKLVENHPQDPLYVDKGMDYYASRTFRDYDSTLTTVTSMGWVATWDYAQLVPSTYGKGFWSIPRNLSLKTYPEGLRLIQTPVSQLEALRYNEITCKRNLEVGVHKVDFFTPSENSYELDFKFDVEKSNVFGLNLCVGNGRKVTISYDTDSYNLVIDRTNCTDACIPKFSRMEHAKVVPSGGKLRLHFYVDRSSIELFANDGKDVFTFLTYPDDSQTGMEIFALKEGTKYSFKGWMLKSVWTAE